MAAVFNCVKQNNSEIIILIALNLHRATRFCNEKLPGKWDVYEFEQLTTVIRVPKEEIVVRYSLSTKIKIVQKLEI